MQNLNIKTRIIIKLIFCLIVCWISGTSFIQRLKCVKMSETELFLSIPNSIVLDYKTCK